MLDRPFQEVLDSGQPDLPFALCWANESWYRRWQGTLDEMILEQVFSEEDDIAHIRWLIECFKDPRYIRIHGRPLLAIYRAHFLPDPKRTIELWRSECDEAGMEAPWLVMFETGEALDDPAVLGFDASRGVRAAPSSTAHREETVPIRPGEFPPDVRVRRGGIGLSHSPGGGVAALPLRADSLGQLSSSTDRGSLDPPRLTPEKYGRWLDEAVARQSRSAGTRGHRVHRTPGTNGRRAPI